MNKNWLEVEMKADKTAHLKIHGVIGGGFWDEGVTSEQVDADLESIKSLKADTIIVDLDSGGGSVLHGIKIHNLLKENPAKIKVKGSGIVASIATVIAAAADDGQFSMSNNSFYLIHEARVGTGGTKAQIARDVQMLDGMNSTIANIYSEKFNISEEEAMALMSINGGEGEFLTSAQAKDRGYIDSVYKPVKATAQITEEKLKEYKINAKVIMEDNKTVEPTKVVEPTNEINTESIVASVVEAVKNVLKPKDTKEEVNVEELIVAQVKEVADEFNANLETLKAENVEALKVETDKYDVIKAELDSLKAVGSDVIGDDAKVDDTKKVLTEADKAANEFKAQLSSTDKMLMSNNEKK